MIPVNRPRGACNVARPGDSSSSQEKPLEDRPALWRNHILMRIECDGNIAARVEEAGRAIEMTSASSPRSGRLRLVNDEVIYADLSNGSFIVRVEDQDDDPIFLEYTDELISIIESYISGDFTEGAARSRHWIDFPFIDSDGNKCRERVYSGGNILQRIFLSDGGTICDE